MKFLTSAMMASSTLISAQAMAAETPAIALVHGAFEDVHVWDGVSRPGRRHRAGREVIHLP
jgi:hypothetical protein